MTAILYQDIVAHLLSHVPEFEPVCKEHVQQYGEVLLHVLFGDLVRFTKEVCESLTEPRPRYSDPNSILLRILDFIEQAANSEDEKVLELVQVSFMENLHQVAHHSTRIVGQLGAKSLELLNAIEQ